MHRLIKGIVIAVCLHWPISASAAPATCTVLRQPIPLTFNESSPTRLETETVSSFRLNCSCTGNEFLNDNINGSIVQLSIVQSQTNVYNGEPGIMFKGSLEADGVMLQESSSDFEMNISPLNYQPPISRAYEVTYFYTVRVLSRNGEPLQASQVGQDYAVAVKFDLFNPPDCRPPS
jgi:hypothetical protein